MLDLETAVLVFLIADCVFWGVTLWRVLSLERVARPLIRVVEPWLKVAPKVDVPAGALGGVAVPRSPAPTPGPQTALPMVRKQFTSRGRLITTERGSDGKWRIVANVPAPVGSATGGEEPVPDGKVDLNALARRFGYEPEQIAAMVGQYAGGDGETPPAPTGLREIPAELAAKIPALGGGGIPEQLVSKFLTGDLSQADAALAAPIVLKALRDANARAKAGGSSGPSGSDRW